MAELSHEERERIYEEEKIRREAQQKLKQEEQAKQAKIGCYSVIGFVVFIFILALIISLGGNDSKTTSDDAITLNAIAARTLTQIEITNNDNFIWRNVEMTINPTLTSGYDYNISIMMPGHTVTIGLLNFTKNDGTRFNPFNTTVKELHILADTEQGKGVTALGWDN
jgi:hypothetical protein